MKGKIIIFYIIFIIKSVYSNEILNELIEKLEKNQKNMYEFSLSEKKLIEENKLYLIPYIGKGWFLINIDKEDEDILIISESDNQMDKGITDYKVYKEGNK